MKKISDPKELKKYLNKISRVFDIDSISRQAIDTEYVVDYYQQSDHGYRTFHSAEGSVHMSLNFDGVFNKDGYYEQASIVSKSINELSAKRVLELGSGKGFNSIVLAKHNPGVEFIGIDLVLLYVSQAQEKGKWLTNLRFQIGNFQALEFASQTFDLLFEVESICHAKDMKLALSESYRVLKPGGRFILFDGFRKPGFEQLEANLQIASKLAEVSMAVDHSWIIEEWIDVAREVGFKEIEVRDISFAIMPNLTKFQILARGYFKYPRVARALLRRISPHLIRNSIAGLLMPFTIEAGAQGYYMITLERARGSKKAWHGECVEQDQATYLHGGCHASSTNAGVRPE